jgi:hypothetical protein
MQRPWATHAVVSPGPLPGRAHPADHPHHPHRRVRRALPHLPAAGAVHQIPDRPKDRATRTRHAVTPGPPGLEDEPALRERYRRHRPNIERVIAQVASRGGRRLKLRYRGAERNNAWLKQRTAALDLRNLINRGVHRADG